MTTLEILKESDGEYVVFENPSYETAIVGLTTDVRVVYDYDLMVEYLVNHDQMDEEEAAEFVDYNTIRSLPYVENAPIVMHKIDF